MKATRILAAAVAAAGLLAGSTALAGVTNTRHDMRPVVDGGMGKTVGTLQDRGVCSYCHVPHGAQGDRLWPGGMATNYTPVANLCASCHLSGAIIQAGFESQKMFNTGAHKFDETVLTNTGTRYNQGQSLAGAALAGLPYVGDTDTDMDCTSCHDPHSNTAARRPFLRMALTSLCQACHGARVPSGTMNLNTNGAGFSQHPANGERTSATRPITWGTLYAVSADLTGASLATAGKWVLGGHKTDGSINSTATGGVTCVTCHPIHGFDPSYNDALPALDLLVKSPFAPTSDLCRDCHLASPGAAGTTSHPINSGVSPYAGSLTGNTLTVAAALLTAGNTLVTSPSQGYTESNGGASGAMTCVSCHDTHFGENNTPILVDTSLTTRNAWCQACHTYNATDGTGVITNRRHHPSQDQAVTTWDNTSWTANADTAANTGYSATLNCATCHRAHNARGQGLPGTAQFILRAYNYATGTGTPTSMMCVLCHTTNPAAYRYSLAPAGAEYGSHFVSMGNNAAAGGQPAGWDWTSDASYNDAYLPGIQTNGSSTGGAPEKNGNWVYSTGMDYAGLGNTSSFSKYGSVAFSWSTGATNSGRTGGVICESCHSITNPRDDGTTAAGASYFLLGQFNATDRNAADNATLYAAAGTETSQGGDGLCRGCHGVPQGTHPTTGVIVSKTNAALDTTSNYADAAPTGGEAFYPAANAMTCTSCHDTHNGNTGAGFWILKEGFAGAAMGSGTTLGSAVRLPSSPDYTDLCAACHSNYR